MNNGGFQPHAVGWAYTIRVGWSDEFQKWVAQVIGEDGEEECVETGDKLNDVLGKATVAVMEVEDDLEDLDEQ
jgi:hypothetical protein